ncbi:type I glyceraldehyde-3-phosphate dehydrogenase [Litorivita sp. NS0012-18]|uniref:type I glyceraldehyde-3-phosphate dehydrogenase n=1 Tax=Litorivita sp. NS0012-18 TaxID=3127655 RepID=UPI003108FA74
MPTTLAINGFGRIGRSVLRAWIEASRDDVEIVAINDLAPIETNAHLLRYDSVHGRFNAEVEVDGDELVVNGRRIRVTAERDPAKLPWAGVDVALECTGLFTARDKAAAHLQNGSGKVLISAPGEGADKTIVFGVNDDTLTGEDRVVSNASCTTNCLAPLAKVLDDAFGIETGYMTTVHSYTGDQPTLDTAHKDLYRARGAALSMIPTSTGAARAVSLVLPHLKGKLDGSAIRVPTPNVSVIDLTFMPRKPATAETVNAAIRAAAEHGPLAGILGISDAPLVSSDFNHDPHSSVFAEAQTKVTEGGMVRVLSWYDNEWGFSNRMLDTAAVLAAAGRSARAAA